MAPHLIRLRTASACAACGLLLPARGEGWWDPDDESTRCETCAVATAPLPGDRVGAAGAAVAVAGLIEEPAPEVSEPPEGARRIEVRYESACVMCGAPLAAGRTAWWEEHTQTMRCDACIGARVATPRWGAD